MQYGKGLRLSGLGETKNHTSVVFIAVELEQVPVLGVADEGIAFAFKGWDDEIQRAD